MQGRVRCIILSPRGASSVSLKGTLGEQESWKGAALWLLAIRLMTGPCAAWQTQQAAHYMPKATIASPGQGW